jgi:sugar O-acyltransferase (sialic acid O-acetyltransferase NeuD family)
MLHRLIIVGAGGFGREVLAWATDIALGGGIPVAGFLDDSPRALDGFDIDVPILTTPADYEIGANDRFICAVGDPETRMHMCEALSGRGARFATLVHPSAIVGPRCRLGEGSIVCPRAVITTDVTVGRHVVINVMSSVGHNAQIDDYCTLSVHCDVTGYARLKQGVFMGSHASVLPSVEVGEFARIGAGSVVLHKVKPRATMLGVPAKILTIKAA